MKIENSILLRRQAEDETPALDVEFGCASEARSGERNEDFFGLSWPAGRALATKGILAALADGTGGGGGGRIAAEFVARSVFSDYYLTPENWEVARSLGAVLDPINRWLYHESTNNSRYGDMVTSLSALVLRGQRCHIAHVGDTRIYHLSGDSFEQVTTDHVWQRKSTQRVLRRAVGMDERLLLESLEREIRVRDIFLLISDGVWEMHDDRTLRRYLELDEDPQETARAIVKTAVAKARFATRSDTTALVLRIDALP
jgi:serine/threonine protein phosphatase PrpC